MRNDEGKIKLETKLYRKPTDALRFLNWDWVPYAQYLRISARNTEEENKDNDIEKLANIILSANYNRKELDIITQKVKTKSTQKQTVSTQVKKPLNI